MGLTDEQRLLRLVESAVELDGLESDVCGTSPLQASAARALPIRKPRRRRGVLAACGALAALALILLLSRSELTVRKFDVHATKLRGSADTVDALLELNRPAFIRLVLIDERGERWIMPLGHGTDFVRRVPAAAKLSFRIRPNSGDPRGSARALFVVLIATDDPQPSADEVLTAIPDPVISGPPDGGLLAAELDRLSSSLSRRWECAVEFRRVP